MRSRPWLFTLLAPAFLLLTACDGGPVTVQVSAGPATGEAQPVEDVVVQFVPYDRDSIFEAMASRAEEPEPEIPQDLREQFDQVIEAQQVWRDAESQWNRVRDSLKQLSGQMEGLDRQSREYLELFDTFNELEKRVSALDQRRAQLFGRFDSLQKATVTRADSVQSVILAWEDDAFEGYTALVDSLLEARGIEVRSDTTDGEGFATVNLPGGDWWVYARHTPGPFEELYWNFHVVPSEADTLTLERENAEVRPRL